jgi:hypothetical protein
VTCDGDLSFVETGLAKPNGPITSNTGTMSRALHMALHALPVKSAGATLDLAGTDEFSPATPSSLRTDP